jgi:predicted site-specific integrase-resolvase
MQITNMKQTAELIGVTYFSLQAAIFHGRIPEPAMKVGSHKLFTPEEVENARRYFEALHRKRAAKMKQ